MNKKIPPYRLIDHTADIGIVVEANDLKSLFKNAALSMIHVILGKIPEETDTSLRLDVEGEDMVDLMVNWLSEILYLFEGEKKIMTEVEIKTISSKNISAILHLIPFDEKKHEIQSEIKAVTYHQLNILKKNNHWEASIIFDI